MALWSAATSFVADVMLEGIARVRRCNLEVKFSLVALPTDDTLVLLYSEQPLSTSRNSAVEPQLLHLAIPQAPP